MKRVLIVDDEFLVRLGLKTTIDWEAHGYKIVGEAANGKEALEIFDRLDPDILLTDIKMPFVDGLKLIEEVQKKKRHLKVVILSNYDDFAFAQKAVKFGAARYILKSEMNEANLIELLETLSDKGREEAEEITTLKIDRENYLKDQLFGKPANDDFLPSALSSPPKNLFQNANYILVKGFCETSQLTDNSRDMLSNTVKNIIEHAFSQSVTVSTFYKNQFYFTSIVQFNEKIKANLSNVLDYMKQLIRNIKQYFDVVVQIGISDRGGPERFTYMIAEAELARKSCFFTLNSIGQYNEMVMQNGKYVRISYTKLSSFIDEDRRKELTEYINEIFNRLKRIGSYPIYNSAIIDLLSIAKSICETCKLDQLPSLAPIKFSYDNFSAMPFISDAEIYIQGLYDTISEAKINHEPDYSLTIRNALSYIKTNYASNITLSDVAEAVLVSSSYLSLIFKQETGVNFSNYLSNYRIEQAKKMLISSNKKIYEIANDVGFSSPYYFSKVFKEVNGLTCKEYKDKFNISPD